MKIVVSTYDKNVWLIPGFAYLFNKYWSPKQEVTVLGFKPPELPLPGNFRFESMAPSETKSWTDHHRDWLSKQNCKYFLYLLEDYYLCKPIRRGALDILVNAVKNGADKCDLNCNILTVSKARGRPPIPYKSDSGLIKAADAARYRTSLQPCIWSKDLFMKLLVPGRDPWQFETRGNDLTRGRLIVALKDAETNPVYPMINVQQARKIRYDRLASLPMEDRAALAELGFKDIFNKGGVKYATV